MKLKTLIIFSFLTFVSCVNSNKVDDSLDLLSKTKYVKIVKPINKSFSSELKIIGNVLANKQVSIHSMEGGNISELYKDIGDKVKGGEVLALLSNPELARDLKTDEVTRNLAKKKYDRLKKIWVNTPALTTIQDFETVESEYLTAKAKYESTHERYDLLKIKAPFSGIITKRMVELGQLVQSGLDNVNASPLFEIMDIETIRVVIALPETEVDNIHQGMNAKIIFPELPGQEVLAKVSRMSNAVSLNSKTMEVQFDVSNKSKKIRPGMYSNVTVDLQSSSDKLSLPVETLTAIKGEYYLLKVKDGEIKKVYVKKGLSNSKFFEVLSNDIDQDSQVVIEGKAMVSEGEKVNAIE